jgi:hypothetical protein
MSKLARYSLWFLACGFLTWTPFLCFLVWLLLGGQFANWNVVGLFILSGYLAVFGGGLSWIVSIVVGVIAARNEKMVLYWVMPHMILMLAGYSTLLIWLNLPASITSEEIVEQALLAAMVCIGIVTGVLSFLFAKTATNPGGNIVDDARGAKLIASAMLIAAGGICISLSEHRGGLGFIAGAILLCTGIPLLVIQWRAGRRRFPQETDEAPMSTETGIKASKDLEI